MHEIEVHNAWLDRFLPSFPGDSEWFEHCADLVIGEVSRPKLLQQLAQLVA
jgi:hypothetical protein